MQEHIFSDKTDSVRISSTRVLLENVEPIQARLYLRGQSDQAWGLLPTIARTDYWFAGHTMKRPFTLLQERNLLHRFRRYTYENEGRVMTKWEVFFLARHHGLPVRLLDWTTNPLVALYWACEFGRETTTDGAIWVFCRRDRDLDIDVFEEPEPNKIAGIRLIYPFYPSRRITAQSGLFTIHAHPWPDLSTLSATHFPTTDNDVVEGEKWCVPKNSKPAIIRELARLGIDERTLFPELDGLARGLLHTELLFRCT